MFARDYKVRKAIIRMDPDCAICHAPASLACDCEAKGLEIAVRRAEAKMMESMYDNIRQWVRSHAQDYILEYFRLLTDRRKQAHHVHLERINATAYHYYHQAPHPNEIAAAQAALKRGIDEDWQQSVQRYPEVLEYFYSLVDFTLPEENDQAVRDPPLSAMTGANRKVNRRGGGPATIASGEYAPPPERPALPRGRTPPPERRTPGPRGNRAYGRPPAAIPPPPPPGYFPPYGH